MYYYYHHFPQVTVVDVTLQSWQLIDSDLRPTETVPLITITSLGSQCVGGECAACVCLCIEVGLGGGGVPNLHIWKWFFSLRRLLCCGQMELESAQKPWRQTHQKGERGKGGECKRGVGRMGRGEEKDEVEEDGKSKKTKLVSCGWNKESTKYSCSSPVILSYFHS